MSKRIIRLTESDLNKIVRRVIKEEIDISQIKKVLPIMINIMLTVIPLTTIPRLIYFISTGQHKEFLNKIMEYKQQIERKLREKGLDINSFGQFVDKFESIKDEFIDRFKSAAKNII